MYPTVTMPSENDFHQSLPSVSEVLTSMSSVGVIRSESEAYITSTANDLMDHVSSGYTPSSMHSSSVHSSVHNSVHNTVQQHAIPTSVITPTTALANGWLEQGQHQHGANLHGGFVPPAVSSTSGLYAMPTGAIRSVPHHQQQQQQQRVNMSDADGGNAGMAGADMEMDMMRMSPPSNSRRRIRDDELAPDERVKRKVRRERNKLAAAKCRQRRVDLTNTLVEETEDWEVKNSSLEQEMVKLQQQKEQLEFILEAHKAMCKKNNTATGAHVGTTATSVPGIPATSRVVALDTPSTEVVTPTSVFKVSGLESFQEAAAAAASTPAVTCGGQIKRESCSSSDMSSPEPNRTMIEL